MLTNTNMNRKNTNMNRKKKIPVGRWIEREILGDWAYFFVFIFSLILSIFPVESALTNGKARNRRQAAADYNIQINITNCCIIETFSTLNIKKRNHE